MAEGNFFHIKSRLNGMVLDVKGGGDSPGTEVMMSKINLLKLFSMYIIQFYSL